MPTAIRPAIPADVERICDFGAAHVPPHYAPLIGAEAAASQVTRWWSETQIATGVDANALVLAVEHDRLVGVAQVAVDGDRMTLYKLYLDPDRRSQGLGPRLIAAVMDLAPPGVERLHVEHFAANRRAAAFYDREGFAIDRIDRDASDAALDVVWRSRAIGTTALGPSA